MYSILVLLGPSQKSDTSPLAAIGNHPLLSYISSMVFCMQNCKHLRLAGLMTIGQPDYSSRPENFTCLASCRADVAAALGMTAGSLELSMGMSGDFEQAVRCGECLCTQSLS